MAAVAPVGDVDIGRDIDPSVSPVVSIDTNTTPDTEFSPPDSPFRESAPPKDKRLLARKKLATLTLEEKVRYLPTSARGHEALTLSRCRC